MKDPKPSNKNLNARVLFSAALLAILAACDSSDSDPDVPAPADPTVAPDGTAGDTECGPDVAEGTSGGRSLLNASDVQQVVIQGVEQALADGAHATIAVVDRNGFILGVFAMTGAPTGPTAPVAATSAPDATPGINAAIVKARTAAFFSSDQQAFTTRTAAFIVQRHFPPGVESSPGGPLYGVQNSSDAGSDVLNDPAGIGSNPTDLTPPFDPIGPNGISGSLGGIPLYKGGRAVGGVGVSSDKPEVDEHIAVGASASYAAPLDIRGCQILVDIRLPFHSATAPYVTATLSFGALPGAAVAGFPITASTPLAGIPEVTLGGVTGELRFPIVASPVSALNVSDVTTIITNAANTARQTRALIRRPLGAPAQVWISVVDTAGNILGVFRTPDATMFSFDVSVQKARTAVVYSDGTATAALGEPISGVPLGTAMTTRAVGFLAQDFYPPGIDGSGPGQLFGIQDALPGGTGAGIPGLDITPATTADATNGNGITIFPGGIPLYKGGVLVGGIGVSGDGVDQDDFIASAGTTGYEPAAGLRADNFEVLGARLPYLKFPRNPTEGVR